MNSQTHLGFIGLGHLGSRIARRLVTAGFPVTVFNRDRAKTEELGKLGADVAADPRDLAARVDVVLSCLADKAAVESVYLGSGGVLRASKPGTVIIEMSTVAAETAQTLSHAGLQLGLAVLDVPVSGSTPAAEAGALTLFGGGDRQAFEDAGPIFAAIARQWFYMGPSGSGVAMKLVVNTLLGVGMQAVAEAAALGQKLGLQREALFDTLAKTAVVAPALAGKLATARQNDYTAQFPVRLMSKDFGLILAAAAQLAVSMPATERAAEVSSAEAASGGEEDFSAVIRRMEEWAPQRSTAGSPVS
jgi:3-hydroxyisobutyrate dehydrogenase-like beta-hydroxyacid dehydrogenase